MKRIIVAWVTWAVSFQLHCLYLRLIKDSCRLKGCQTTAQVFPLWRKIVLAGGNIPTKTSCPEGFWGGKFCFYLFPSFTTTFSSTYASTNIGTLFGSFTRLNYLMENTLYRIRLDSEFIFRLCISERHHFAEMGPLSDFFRKKERREFSSSDLLHLLWVKVQFGMG